MNRTPALIGLGLALIVVRPGASNALEIVRAPYLQMMEPTGPLVVFRTNDPCAGEVRLGPTAVALDTIIDGEQTAEHQIRLGGLAPNTEYYYAVWCNDLRLEPEHVGHFTTPPQVGARRPFRAWIVGDSGTGGLPQMRVRDAAVAHWQRDPPDLFLHLGDMAYGDGTDLQFTLFFFGMYADILRDIPIFPTMGNHEGHSSVAANEEGPYYEAYVLPRGGELGGLASGTEAYYSYDWANVHFIVLESHESDRTPQGAMLSWLEQDLAATDADWVVSYWHHPPYTKGSHNSDTEANLVEMRENALPILESGGVDLVLGGHSHTYERSYLLQGAYETPSTELGIVDNGSGRADELDGPYVLGPGLAGGDGTLYVVAGHGGTGTSQAEEHPLMWFTEPINGSLIMDVSGDRLSLRNIRQDGVQTDYVTLLKGPGIDVISPDGGEILEAGAVSEVRFGGAGLTEDLSFAWSCDDGVTWRDVGTAPVDSVSFAWTVPRIATSDARLRVTSGAVSDVSDARFAVQGAGLDACPVPPPPPPADGQAADDGCGRAEPDNNAGALLPLCFLAVGGVRRRDRASRSGGPQRQD
jgi:hypothetical protein